MSLVGLDLNATRVRAVLGKVSSVPAGLPLFGSERDLPLALNLEGRSIVVGRSALTLCRRAPHLACVDFLLHLGQPQTWTAGRHNLDASQALELVFAELYRVCGRGKSAGIALPTYLNETQAQLAAAIAEKCGLRSFGTLAIPLATAVAVQTLLPWTGLALVVDVDGGALTWSAVVVDAYEVRLVRAQVSPRLALGIWLNRLLEFVANRCVRVSRRDPRQSADAEQSIFDQLYDLLQRDMGNAPIDLSCQAPQWSQHLMLQPAELAGACDPLVQQAIVLMRQLLAATTDLGPTMVVLLTPEAARLPGLLPALHVALAGGEPVLTAEPAGSFVTSSLAQPGEAPTTSLHVADEDAVARGAHFLACRISTGDLPPGHHEAVPLPGGARTAEPLGPARLQFQGLDHVLAHDTFILGRSPDCDLVFDTNAFPTVSGRHCEIVFAHRIYTLRDTSRHGTLVNDKPVEQQVALQSGDWIRLGPLGPMIRFLGEPQATNVAPR